MMGLLVMGWGIDGGDVSVHTLLMAYEEGLSSLSTVFLNCTDGMLRGCDVVDVVVKLTVDEDGDGAWSSEDPRRSKLPIFHAPEMMDTRDLN